MSSSSATTTTITKVYRELLRYAKAQGKVDELRSSFQMPLSGSDTVESRLLQAQDRLSFLRITSVKRSSLSQSTSPSRQRWVYKNGQRYELDDDSSNITLRDNNNNNNSSSRVISSFDGKNMDPQAVSRHRKSLRRAGFVNNAHAKGLF